MDFMELAKETENIRAVGDSTANIGNFEEKYTKFVSLIAGTSGHSKIARQITLKEAETTPDFPVLFGTVLERMIRQKYTLANQQDDWRAYTKTGTINDFRMAWEIMLYGNRKPVTVVKERGEYQDDTLNDGKWQIGIQKYGKGFGLSWEAVINDDLGAFSDIADDLVISVKQATSLYVTKLFAGANGPLAFSAQTGSAATEQVGLFSAAGTHPIDGTLFANYVTATPLTASNLQAAISALKSQKDYNGNPILFNKFHLVVPVNKEFAALQILSNSLLIASALSSNSSTSSVLGTTSENILARYGIQLHVNPWLDTLSATYGPYSWYLFGDPADGNAMVMKFLRGKETPEVCQKMSDKISLGGAPISPLEGDFDSDSIRWRIRHIFGGSTTDPRFAYGAQSTT